MKEIACLRRHVRGIARPYRHRQQHDVHRRKARNCEAFQQPLRARLFFEFDAPLLERIGAVARARQRRNETASIDLFGHPDEPQTLRREIEPRGQHARASLHRALDVIEAGRAIDIGHRQIHRHRTVGGRADIEREINLILRGGHHFTGKRSMRLTERKRSAVASLASSVRSHCPAPTGATP